MITELSPPERILMGPGPSAVPPAVLRAMGMPLLGHLDPAFLQIMDDVRSMLRSVFQTENDLTFAISATGSAGMEACFVNLVEPGDQAVVCVNGVFGNRMCDVAQRCGADVVRVDAPWGQPIEATRVDAVLESTKPKLVAIVHAETSTGVLQPLEKISRLAHAAGALLVVDAVTSLGGVEVCVDEWEIDAIYSGTQKCLSAPPGLAPVSFSPRAVDAIRNRKHKTQSWYLDASMLMQYWGSERAYHHTAPISAIYALHAALTGVLDEGLPARFERHRKTHELLREGLVELGFEFVVDPEFRLPQLNAVSVPAGVDEAKVRSCLLHDFHIEIGGGLGDFAGKVWRIGLMGHSCSADNVKALLSALQEIL